MRPTENPSCSWAAKVSCVAKVRNGVHSSTGNSSLTLLNFTTTYGLEPSGSAPPGTTPSRSPMYPKSTARASRPATNWKTPAPVLKLRWYGMSPPLAASTPTLLSVVGDASASTGPRMSMSPGMSQNGMRIPRLRPVRAATWGKRAAVPMAAHPGASPHPFFCAVSASKPASMKAIPVPTDPVSPSDPNPSRTPAPTLPVAEVSAAEPKATPPESWP